MRLFTLRTRPLWFAPALLCAVSLGGLGLYGLRTASAAPDDPNAPTAPVAIDSDLEKAMQAIDEGVDALEAAVEKKDAPAALELVAKIESSILIAKLQTPPKTKSIEEKGQAAFVSGFRKSVAGLLKTFCDAEIALCDADFTKAGAALEEAQRLKKAGHDQYKKKKK
jgi:hypothetical protein